MVLIIYLLLHSLRKWLLMTNRFLSSISFWGIVCFIFNRDCGWWRFFSDVFSAFWPTNWVLKCSNSDIMQYALIEVNHSSLFAFIFFIDSLLVSFFFCRHQIETPQQMFTLRWKRSTYHLHHKNELAKRSPKLSTTIISTIQNTLLRWYAQEAN